MGINTDKIEKILRNNYGWDRFPLNEDLSKPKRKRKKKNIISLFKEKDNAKAYKSI
tara:strand:+ start:177 stop:344 length:168 start_codon:yes stop_codon:yes gene_type:complete